VLANIHYIPVANRQI